MMAGSRSGNVVTPWSSLKDGREYIVSLSVIESPQALSILLTDKITAEEWSCQYDFKHIGDLTRMTGSYKTFETFVSMIKNAILKSTDSVSVELYTFQELKHIKIQRHNHGVIAMNEFVGSILKDARSVDYEYQNQRPGFPWAPVLGTPKEELEKKKFLIITYNAEFDSVNYPLPLTYSGLPDPSKMQNDIKKLKLEVSQLKNANLQLRDQLRNKENRIEDNDPLSSSQRRREDRNLQEMSSLTVSAFIQDDDEFSRRQKLSPSRNNENQNQGQQQAGRRSGSNDSDNQRKVSPLLSMVAQLEDRIENQKYIFIDRIHKLETENERLSKQMEKYRRDEEMYLLKINQLQEEIRAASASWSESRSRGDNRNRGQCRRPTGSGGDRQSDRMSTQTQSRGSGGGDGSRPQSRSRTGCIVSSVPPSPRNTPRSRATATTCSHGHPQTRSRPRPEKEVCPRFLWSQDQAPERERQLERDQSISPRDERRTSVSASRSLDKKYDRPAFDPTAYVQQKKARQLEINKQRLTDIKRSLEETRKQLRLKSATTTASRSCQSGRSQSRRSTDESPYRRSLSNNSRASQRVQTGSESGRDKYGNDRRSKAFERPSRSRLRRIRENPPQQKPRSRLTGMRTPPVHRIPFSNYEPGHHTESRLKERRARSISAANGQSASASGRSQSRSARIRRTTSPKSTSAQSDRSRHSSTLLPRTDIDERQRHEGTDAFSGGHAHLASRSSKLMPKVASTDLTKEISDSDNVLSHRSRTRSFLAFDDGVRMIKSPKSKSHTSSRETIDIPTRGRRSPSRLSRSSVRSRVDRNNDSLGQEPTSASALRAYHYEPELEAVMSDLTENRYVGRGPGDFRNRNYSPVGVTFFGGSGIFGRRGRGTGSGSDLIPPPKPARRIDSLGID